MIIDVECSFCNGLGEINATTPNMRARYVRHDDLDPGDYTEPCPRCEGSGHVLHDLNEECDDE